jgi:RHS repeat-associated protein
MSAMLSWPRNDGIGGCGPLRDMWLRNSMITDGSHPSHTDPKLGLSWLLGDRQGSMSGTVDAGAGSATRNRYLPFGGNRDSAGTSTAPTDRGWLGRTRDSDTGLDYLNARYYDPDLAHFISIDPLDDESTPQHANPYGYGADNPVRFADPSGLSYRVKQGDDWNTVSRLTGLSFQQLRAHNGGSLKALRRNQIVNTTMPGSMGDPSEDARDRRAAARQAAEQRRPRAR